MSSLRSFVPEPTEIACDALIVLAGALIAAAIVGQLPSMRAWIVEQWGGAPH